MSNPGQPQDTPQVQVVANPQAAATAFAPRTNQALELAGSLADLSPVANEFARTYADQAQSVARASAQKKAIELKGQGFADAVRQGKIDPTASPWWMTAYKQESAKVSTLDQVDALNTQAASWQEQSNPAAFRDKYTKALAQIGEQYTDPDEKLGFDAAAGPAQDHAFAANTEQNVQAIQESRIQNLSALASKGVMQATSDAGGKPTAAAVNAALEPLKQQYLATGGRLPDWNQKVAIPAIQAAAFETWNPGVLDTAKGIDNGSGGSLYDEAGAAEGIETIRHRIDQDNRMRLSQNMEMAAMQRQQDMLAAQSDLFKLAGPSLFTGQISQDQIQQYTQQLSQNHNPASVVAAIKDAADIGSSYREIATNKATLYAQSAPGVSHLGALHQEATTQGWTPEFGDELGSMALNGEISVSTQDQLMDLARKRSLAQSTVPTVSPNSPRVFNAQAANIDAWRGTRDYITKTIASTTQALTNRSGIQLTPGQQEAIQDAAINAASDHIQTTAIKGKTKDFTGAKQAATQAAQAWLNDYLKRLQGGTK